MKKEFIFSCCIIFLSDVSFASHSLKQTVSGLTDDYFTLRTEFNNFKKDTDSKFQRYEAEIDALKRSSKTIEDKLIKNTQESVPQIVHTVIDQKLEHAISTIIDTCNNSMNKNNDTINQALTKIKDIVEQYKEYNIYSIQAKKDIDAKNTQTSNKQQQIIPAHMPVIH